MAAYYRRRLPHLQFNEGIYFVTFGLVHSLPRNIIKYLREERQRNNQSDRASKLYFKKYDHLLDKGNGQTWLAREEIATVIANKIHQLDGKRYQLLCFTIMPNHVHILLELTGSRAEARGTGSRNRDRAARYPVTHILKLIKGATARECNKILGRTGQFWHHESYDRLVRNHRERDNIISYILENPVKAGLVDQFNEWKWSYVREDALPLR